MPRRNACLLLLAIALTLTDGIVHGRWTYRWGGVPAEKQEAAARLRELPVPCGDWELVEAKPLSDFVTNILQCEAHLNRVYIHRLTGEKVQVTIVLGPFGPTSTHTPDMCYTSREYKIRQERQRVRIPSGADQESELWVVGVQSENLEGERLRVYYGWSEGGPWKAPQVPRASFGGRPFLYKIQASTVVPSDSERRTKDACQSFLEGFLPAIQPYLVSAR